MSWEDKYKEKFISAKDAAGLVKSGEYVVFALDQMPHNTRANSPKNEAEK